MRRLVIALLIGAVWLIAAAPTVGHDTTPARLSAGRAISVRLPHGWHVIRRLINLAQPAVLASFPATFARHPCPCAKPNYRTCGVWCQEPGIRNFPRAGVLVFLWEQFSPRNPADLGRGSWRRPAWFRVGQENPHFTQALARELRALHRGAGHACVAGPGHPSWWSRFREAGRVFQVEVYLGPDASGVVRARTDALLDSLQVGARHG